MGILIAVFVTFCVTAAWQLSASRKIRANHRLMVVGLIGEMDEMAEKLGHPDLISYLRSVKGQVYAANAEENLKSFYNSLTDRGA